MATPIYQYPSSSGYGSAISGAMTALGGGLMEIEAAGKAKKRFQVMAQELGDRGLVGDAAIYQSIADTTTPNFLQAALTGKPTDHNSDKLTDHALKILGEDRALRVKEMQTRDQSFLPNISLSRQEISSINSRLATLRKEKDETAEKLADPSQLDEQSATALVKRQKEIDVEIDELSTSKNQVQSEAQTLINQHTRVKTGRADTYTTPNGSVEPLPFQPDGSSQELPGQKSLLPDTSRADGINRSSNVPGTDIPNIPITPMDSDTTIASGVNMMNPYAPTSLASNIRTRPAASVTEPGSKDVVSTAKMLFEADVAAYKESGGKRNPQTRKQLDFAIKELKPEVTGPLLASTQEEADVIAKRFEDQGKITAQRSTPQGKIAVSSRDPSTSSSGGGKGLTWAHPSGKVYSIQGQRVVELFPDGQSRDYRDPNTRELITPTKMREIVRSWNARNPDNPMEVLGDDFKPKDLIPSISPIAPPSIPSYNGGGLESSYETYLRKKKAPP